MPEPDGTAPLVCVRWVTALSGMNCAAMGLEVGFKIMEAASKFCPTWYFPSSWRRKKTKKQHTKMCLHTDMLWYLWYALISYYSSDNLLRRTMLNPRSMLVFQMSLLCFSTLSFTCCRSLAGCAFSSILLTAKSLKGFAWKMWKKTGDLDPFCNLKF